MWPGFIK